MRRRIIEGFIKPPYLGISIATAIFVVLGWEFICRIGGLPEIILPPPSAVVVAFYRYLLGDMLGDSAATMYKVLAGLSAGMVSGVILGLLVGWYPKVKAALQPLIDITFPIPKIALLPLFIIWFGMGDVSNIVLAWVGCFYIALTNTVVGVESVPRNVVLAARNMGASDVQILRKVVLPASLPIIFASLRICFAICLILVIAVEMLVANKGIGYSIALSGQLLFTDKVFAGLLLSGILGIMGYRLIDKVEASMIPWHKKKEEEGR